MLDSKVKSTIQLYHLLCQIVPTDSTQGINRPMPYPKLSVDLLHAFWPDIPFLLRELYMPRKFAGGLKVIQSL